MSESNPSNHFSAEEAINAAINLFSNFSSLTQADIEFLKSHLHAHWMPARTRLQNFGEVASQIFIVVEGSLRMINRRKEEEFSAAFILENEFCATINSLRQQTPSQYAIETFEDTLYFSAPYEILHQSRHFSPNLNDLIFTLMEDSLCRFEDFFQFYSLNPEARYLYILETKPQLIQRIPQQYLASYLGITPVSLSRIRKRLSQKQHP